MDFNYTEKELNALNKKAMNPNKIVICPRCGNKLTFRQINTSYEVKCLTEDCIKETWRGI